MMAEKLITFAIVRAADKAVETVRYADVWQAVEQAGLKKGEVDFGSLANHNAAIIVYEFGLREPDKHKHFSIGPALYAGNAVLFGVDDHGETVDLKGVPYCVFYDTLQDIEFAIATGRILRPEIRVNGMLISAWPNFK